MIRITRYFNRVSLILAILLLVGLYLPAEETRAPIQNNDFYDNNEFHALRGLEIEVGGEIVNPGKVDVSRLALRCLNVSEAVLAKGKQTFVGSYTYRGYSLFDILKERYLDKKNRREFPSIIDLLVRVENKQGEKVVLSWGEIFYPTALHRIIVAVQVARIIPSKTGERWPLPRQAKLVCGDDLFADRNIKNPSKITVFSAPLHFKVRRNLKPLYSGSIDVYAGKKKVGVIDKLAEQLPVMTYPSVFYGRGKGFHGIRYFEGRLLKSVLAEYAHLDRENVRRGYWVVSAADGYRVAITFAELFNRSDHKEFLIYDTGAGQDTGRFKLFPSADFFSDRAVKAVTGIYFMHIK
jgi:hypothetical protein